MITWISPLHPAVRVAKAAGLAVFLALSFTSLAPGAAARQTGVGRAAYGAPGGGTSLVSTPVAGRMSDSEEAEVAAEVTVGPSSESNAVLNISGTYPHLAVFNHDGEIGIGARRKIFSCSSA